MSFELLRAPLMANAPSSSTGWWTSSTPPRTTSAASSPPNPRFWLAATTRPATSWPMRIVPPWSGSSWRSRRRADDGLALGGHQGPHPGHEDAAADGGRSQDKSTYLLEHIWTRRCLCNWSVHNCYRATFWMPLERAEGHEEIEAVFEEFGAIEEQCHQLTSSIMRYQVLSKNK